MSDILNPYAPIRPDQETAIRDLLRTAPHLLPRTARDRVLHSLHTCSAGHAAWLLKSLRCRQRGEPPPPKPRLDTEPTPTEDRTAVRACIEETEDRLRAGFAGRAMQPIGLGQPSLFAGFGSTPKTTTR